MGTRDGHCPCFPGTRTRACSTRMRRTNTCRRKSKSFKSRRRQARCKLRRQNAGAKGRKQQSSSVQNLAQDLTRRCNSTKSSADGCVNHKSSEVWIFVTPVFHQWGLPREPSPVDRRKATPDHDTDWSRAERMDERQHVVSTFPEENPVGDLHPSQFHESVQTKDSRKRPFKEGKGKIRTSPTWFCRKPTSFNMRVPKFWRLSGSSTIFERVQMSRIQVRVLCIGAV